MRIAARVVAALLLVAAVHSPGRGEDAPPAKKRTLAVVLAKGRKLALDVTMRTVETSDTAGAKMETDIDLAMTHSYDVASVDPKGVATIRTRIDRVRGTLVNPFLGRVAFDSDTKPGAEEDTQAASIRRQLTAAAGQTAVVQLAGDGRFTQVESSAPGRSTAPRLGGIAHLPAASVGVGDTWTTKSETVLQEARLEETVQHAVTGIDADAITIAHDGTLAPARGAAGFTVKSSRITGQTRLSAKDGFVLSSSVVLEAETVTSAAAGRPATTTTTKQTVAQTVRER